MFALQASAVAGEFSGGADDSVAGDDDSDRVCSVGCSDRSDGLWSPHFYGQLRIAECGPGGDGAKVLPNFIVEVGSLGIRGDLVNRGEVAFEVGKERFSDFVGRFAFFEGVSGAESSVV